MSDHSLTPQAERLKQALEFLVNPHTWHETCIDCAATTLAEVNAGVIEVERLGFGVTKDSLLRHVIVKKP